MNRALGVVQPRTNQGLEGIVAKPRTSTYRPGEPGWVDQEPRLLVLRPGAGAGSEPAASTGDHLGGLSETIGETTPRTWWSASSGVVLPIGRWRRSAR
jgi:hypothetical protein